MNNRQLALNTQNLDQKLFRYAIGLHESLNAPQLPTGNEGNYPPHNIEKLNENHYRIVMAVAGFTRDEINITLLKGMLKVEGTKGEDSLKRTVVRDIPTGNEPGDVIKRIEEVSIEYLWQGIGLRNFVREFTLGENVEVKDASLSEGLLVIDLERPAPPEVRAIQIAIK